MSEVAYLPPRVDSQGAETACDYCALPFTPRRQNQRFCCPEHCRAYDAMIHRITLPVRQAIREGLRQLQAVRRSE